MDLRNRKLRKHLEGRNIGLIYSTPSLITGYFSALPKTDAPVISHCHELESVIHRMGLDEFEKTKKMTKHFIAASEAVRRNLVDNHSSMSKKWKWSMSSFGRKSPGGRDTKKRRGSFAGIGNSGKCFYRRWFQARFTERKAPELFILIANEIRKKKSRSADLFRLGRRRSQRRFQVF